MKPLIAIIALFTFSAFTFARPPKKRPTLAMSDMAIESILMSMKNQNGDYRKLDVVKGGVQNNADGITVAQELKLLNQFATDEYKLACAKFLYPWCVDFKAYDKVVYNMASPDAQKAIKAFIAKGGK
ncbi:DUF4476 domain-containing protein [Mucilaginibacter myungsuensis]|uniref:DUF4476 domain-containing protein n=1 Tax=Mucilaginibacter myungsuensis TaxID=649104 RepID=A0A929L3C6_9SPHI|nr:DUF4476 domain-containing protein [Mucilaginibacter myungsuensis]MBE9663300.1 DUF4476 domain-containing protein [Mucilaginibacter myungsuensis]MDN3600035.1 DUF4476 domain-containing protein [Mucilaginibacter myungsuensis]